MKQRHILTIFLTGTLSCICFLYSNAQFTFSPSTTLLKNQALNLMTYDSIQISNTGSSTLKLNWELLEYDTTGGSYFDFCASGTCYLGIPDTGSFPDIPVGQYGYIGAHFWTGNIAAACTTRVRVYNEANPATCDTIIFILNATANGIHNYNILNNAISVYPNPATNHVSVTNPVNTQFTMYVYNSVGQLVLSETTNTLSLSGLQSGRYLIILKDPEGNRFPRTVQLVRQ